jgi:hypothetical protein
VAQLILDFDNIDEWATDLAEVLEVNVSKGAQAQIAAANPEFIEDSRDLLFDLAGREMIIDATLAWIRSAKIYGYHGTRLTDAEVSSVRSVGLLPLKAETRRSRLSRALSSHPRWDEVSKQLDESIQEHGPGCRAGSRQGQVHLTLSRSGLTNGFNHYLTHGSEFDQRVAHALLDEDGQQLLGIDGKPTLIKCSVPGPVALEAAHPFFNIEDVRSTGDVPNVVDEFLKAWSFRLARPVFQPRKLEVDCGMIFRTVVPAEWIADIEILSSENEVCS